MVLCADLDFSNAVITAYPTFSGNFNGNHHTITNVTSNDYGIFQGFNGATAKDLTLDHFTVTANAAHSGTLVGTVKDSTVTGMVVTNSNITSSTGQFVAGLIGIMMGSSTTGCLIQQNKVTTTQITFDAIGTGGGLIGALNSETAVNDIITQNTVNVTLTHSASTYCEGGLIGYISNGQVTQNAVNVTFLVGGYERSGGLLGCFEAGSGAKPMLVKNNSVTFSGLSGDGFARVGGIYGAGETSITATVDSNWINGSVTAGNTTRGMVFGYQYTGSVAITNTYWHNDGSGLAAYQMCASTCTVDGNSGAISSYTTTPFTGGSSWADATIWNFTNGSPPTLVGLP